MAKGLGVLVAELVSARAIGGMASCWGWVKALALGHCHGNFVSQQLINYQLDSGCDARGIPNTE